MSARNFKILPLNFAKMSGFGKKILHFCTKFFGVTIFLQPKILRKGKCPCPFSSPSRHDATETFVKYEIRLSEDGVSAQMFRPAAVCLIKVTRADVC